MKKCSRCEEFKEFSEFYKRKDIKCGLSPMCKSCESEKGKKWRAKSQDYCREYSKTKYINNREEILKKQKESYLKDPKKFNARSMAWQQKNPERVLENQRKRRREKPEIFQAAKARRRAKENVHPDADLKAIKRIYRICSILNELSPIKYQVDHILPLSKGGLHHELNLQIISTSLNKRKGARLVFSHPHVKTVLDFSLDFLVLHPRETLEALHKNLGSEFPLFAVLEKQKP